MTHTNGFYDVDNRRYVLDGGDWPVCGAELLDDYDHDRHLLVLLRALGRGDVGTYSTGDGPLIVRRES